MGKALPVLPLCFNNVAQLPVHSLLQVEGWDNVGIGLADKKIVDIEHLAQTAHWQVFFQGAIPPSPFCLLHRLRVEPVTWILRDCSRHFKNLLRGVCS